MVNVRLHKNSKRRAKSAVKSGSFNAAAYEENNVAVVLYAEQHSGVKLEEGLNWVRFVGKYRAGNKHGVHLWM